MNVGNIGNLDQYLLSLRQPSSYHIGPSPEQPEALAETEDALGPNSKTRSCDVEGRERAYSWMMLIVHPSDVP